MARKTKSRKFAYRVRKGAASRLFDFSAVSKLVAGIGRKLHLF